MLILLDMCEPSRICLPVSEFIEPERQGHGQIFQGLFILGDTFGCQILKNSHVGVRLEFRALEACADVWGDGAARSTQ